MERRVLPARMVCKLRKLWGGRWCCLVRMMSLVPPANASPQEPPAFAASCERGAVALSPRTGLLFLPFAEREPDERSGRKTSLGEFGFPLAPVPN